MKHLSDLKTQSVFIVLLFSTIFSGVSPAQNDSMSSGLIVNFIDGALRAKKPAFEGWVKLDSGAVVAFDDQISTDADSRVELIHGPNQVIRIGPNALAAIPRRSVDSARTVTAFAPAEGDFWIQAVADSTYMLVATHFKRRGGNWLIPESDSAPTEFRVSMGSDSTLEVKTYAGRVRLMYYSARDTAVSSEMADSAEAMTESTLVLAAGEKIGFSSTGKIIYHLPFSANDSDEKSDWVNWNLARGRIK